MSTKHVNVNMDLMVENVTRIKSRVTISVGVRVKILKDIDHAKIIIFGTLLVIFGTL